MAEIDKVAVFDSDQYGRHRSVIFAIVVATGFLSVAAAASTLFAGANMLVGAGLLVVGVALLGVAIGIPTGAVDKWLFGG